MIRSFLPAGQGNFAVEKYENGQSVVFDCGATNVSIAEQLIRETFQKEECILAVFISHLDTDHLNGLKYLLQHCTVKEIYIPFLDSGGKLLTAIEEAAFHRRKLSDFALRFLRNPEEAIGSIRGKRADPTVYRVRPERMGDEDANDSELTVKSGELLRLLDKECDNKQDWIFVPYNFHEVEKGLDLIAFLHKAGIDPEDLYVDLSKPDFLKKHKPVVDYIKNHLYDKEAKAWKDSDSSPSNIGSMVVYSGWKGERGNAFLKRPELSVCFNRHVCPGYLEAGCLYTGDYNAKDNDKWVDLNNKYGDYWSGIGTITVPHHGSSYNFNHELATKGTVFIASAGRHNKYRHPHHAVLIELARRHKLCFWVNEDHSSAVYMVVEGI